jgi:hypothetical protein
MVAVSFAQTDSDDGCVVKTGGVQPSEVHDIEVDVKQDPLPPIGKMVKLTISEGFNPVTWNVVVFRLIPVPTIVPLTR